MRDEIQRLAKRYQFFHWHLAFPQVFGIPGQGQRLDDPQAGGSDGFDLLIGNSPWEKVELMEKEWFATRRPDIAAASTGAKRKKLIVGLVKEDPGLFALYQDAVRHIDGIRHFVRDSGRYV